VWAASPTHLAPAVNGLPSEALLIRHHCQLVPQIRVLMRRGGAGAGAGAVQSAASRSRYSAAIIQCSCDVGRKHNQSITWLLLHSLVVHYNNTRE
jgi:hypothetical protein